MDLQENANVQVWSPNQILKCHGDDLTTFEKTEIDSFPRVYYWGSGVIKTRPAGGKNNGYDDGEDHYIHVLGDHIAYRYRFMELVGKGAYGHVAKVFDHMENKCVALKTVQNQAYCQHVLKKEADVLQHLHERDHDGSTNVVRVLDTFTFRNHFCVIYELLLGPNLCELMRLNSAQRVGLPPPLVKKFSVAILRCLQALSKEGIVHCDLKPDNLQLKLDGGDELKVIDFGSSCFEADGCGEDYFQTRWYRAPEVILDAGYGPPIDMWSFGCIVAEMMTDQVLFPGKDEGDQLARMTDLLDLPPKRFLTNYPRARVLLDSMASESTGSKKWEDALKGHEDPVFIDFMKRCLEWDPSKRLTPTQALSHRWLTGGPEAASNVPRSMRQRTVRYKPRASPLLKRRRRLQYRTQAGLLATTDSAPLCKKPEVSCSDESSSSPTAEEETIHEDQPSNEQEKFHQDQKQDTPVVLSATTGLQKKSETPEVSDNARSLPPVVNKQDSSPENSKRPTEKRSSSSSVWIYASMFCLAVFALHVTRR